MGASTSVSSRILNNIYVSYSEKDSYAILLHEKLIHRNINNFFGPIEYFIRDLDEHTGNTVPSQLSSTVKNIMSNSFYIIIYISRATVCSYYQAIEINNAMQSNTNIVFIMTDKTYTPLNITFLQNFIGNKKWLPAYDEETLNATLEELIPLLQIN